MMRFFKRALFLVVVLASMILLSSWGYQGHYKINNNSQLSFNQEMGQFYEWASVLAEHASDADARKAWDPTEAPKHYIDIDNYPEFIANGTIPQTLDSVISIHGSYWVYDQGILPWATLTAFDSLQSCFERGDWDQAVLFASDLGHYVADAHNPLHITRNYNGQYTGNNGIHSRYESQMIGIYNSQIVYPGYQIQTIENVNQYVFNYLYTNYTYIDSILAADDYAYGVAGNTNSTQYYSALWGETESFTVALFKKASHNLAELIYTAWENAGSPLISSDFTPSINNRGILEQNFPNPFAQKTTIAFNLSQTSPVLLEIRDVSGRPVKTLIDEIKPTGKHQIQWDAATLPPGVYYAVLKSDNKTNIRKMILKH